MRIGLQLIGVNANVIDPQSNRVTPGFNDSVSHLRLFDIHAGVEQ